MFDQIEIQITTRRKDGGSITSEVQELSEVVVLDVAELDKLNPKAKALISFSCKTLMGNLNRSLYHLREGHVIGSSRNASDASVLDAQPQGR